MPDNFEIVSGGTELLDLVKPLWEQLNALHAEASEHFSKSYEEWTFEDRISGLLVKAAEHRMNIDLAYDREHEKNVGYCISTIDEGDIGEVDFIFIEEPYRGQGLGEALMESALQWLERHEVKEKIVAVAEGNEKVLDFYQRFEFYPRRIVLLQKKEP